MSAPAARPPKPPLLITLALHEAQQYAAELANLFVDVAERIEVVGSVRRQKPSGIHDIELLIEPKLEVLERDLFDTPTSFRNLQWDRAKELRDRGTLRDRLDVNGRPCFGKRFQRMTYRSVAVDLFVRLDPAQWGLLHVLRTGPADFSHNLMATLPIGISCNDGALYNGETRILTPTEEDVFRVLQRPYLAPEDRR